MRRLAPRVNVIPVVGKADSLTPAELQAFKRRVMEDIEYYNIPIYNFPYDVEEDDEETIQDNSELRVSPVRGSSALARYLLPDDVSDRL